ncbi:MAG: TIGR01777 family oxidoreductase [Nocardioidaceae bacterium]
MRFVIAGASGFLGTTWRDHLAQQGHEVIRLVRHEAASAHESEWDPYAGRLDQAVIDGADVVACLSGAPLAHWPWTEAYKRTFTDSRVVTTRVLAEAVARSERKPLLLAQNGIAGYGDRGDAPLPEGADTDAPTFMGRVTRAWQGATAPASAAGARVVVMRSGVVLDRRVGALKALRRVFLAGLGGTIGDGSQYFSTISSHDWLRAATYLATNGTSSGVYNVSGPDPTTNAEFARTLGRLLHRPALVPVPAFVVDKLAGTVSSEVLNSTRVVPERLLEEGFVFDQPTLESRLVAALSDPSQRTPATG